MKINESAEDYLEKILMIRNEKGYCREIDICKKMGFSKPSVSVYMKNLKNSGYITIEDGGNIFLTESGAKIADRIYERHNIIAGFLMQLGTSEDTAYEDSCKIEHDISDESFDLIKKSYLKNIGKQKANS